jgi:hypothetical protein
LVTNFVSNRPAGLSGWRSGYDYALHASGKIKDKNFNVFIYSDEISYNIILHAVFSSVILAYIPV